MRLPALIAVLSFVFLAKAQTISNTPFNFTQANQHLTASTFTIKSYATLTDDDDQSDHKYSKGKRQRNAGITLMCLGTIFLAGAITTGVMSTGDNNNLDNKTLILRGACLG